MICLEAEHKRVNLPLCPPPSASLLLCINGQLSLLSMAGMMHGTVFVTAFLHFRVTPLCSVPPTSTTVVKRSVCVCVCFHMRFCIVIFVFLPESEQAKVRRP